MGSGHDYLEFIIWRDGQYVSESVMSVLVCILLFWLELEVLQARLEK